MTTQICGNCKDYSSETVTFSAKIQGPGQFRLRNAPRGKSVSTIFTAVLFNAIRFNGGYPALLYRTFNLKDEEISKE